MEAVRNVLLMRDLHLLSGLGALLRRFRTGDPGALDLPLSLSAPNEQIAANKTRAYLEGVKQSFTSFDTLKFL